MTAAARAARPTLPEPGAMLPVGAGVHWIRMPLPFALDHVNLWAIEDGPEGWTLIDTGVGNDATKQLWETLLEGPLAGRRVTRLIATHCHPDHAGLTGWLAERLDAPVLMTRREWDSARLLAGRGDAEFGAIQRRVFAAHGLDAATLDRLEARGNVYRRRAPHIAETVTLIAEGDLLAIGDAEWRVAIGSGHSPEHACLWSDEARTLIAGDQILETITPNISALWSEGRGDPLGEFLDSVAAFRWLPADALLLPGHGYPFRGAPARLDALAAHHESRLNAVLAACAGRWMTAHDLLPTLFRRRMDDHNIGFAMGEAVAHTVYLARRGYLDQRETGGVFRYRQAQDRITLAR